MSKSKLPYNVNFYNRVQPVLFPPLSVLNFFHRFSKSIKADTERGGIGVAEGEQPNTSSFQAPNFKFKGPI